MPGGLLSGPRTAGGLTAWKDAGGNRAPWATTGAINEGLHVEEPTMHLYRSRGRPHRVSRDEWLRGIPTGSWRTAQRRGVPGRRQAPIRHDGDRPRLRRFHALRLGLSVETHVGDHNAILDGFEAGNAAYPVSRLKWRIAHPADGEPTDDQLARAAELGVGYALTFSTVRNEAPAPRFHSTTWRAGCHVPRL